MLPDLARSPACPPAATPETDEEEGDDDDGGAPLRERGRSLEALPPTATADRSWEATGVYDGDGPAPPTTPKAVRLWVERHVADPADPAAAEGDFGGCRAVASVEGWPPGRVEREDALPGRAVALVFREALVAAGHWTSPDVDLGALRAACRLASRGGAVRLAVESHLRAARVDRAAVVLRGAARGLRAGVARCLAAARRPRNGATTTVPADAWYALLEAANDLRAVAARVFDDEALALSLHPHFVEYAVAELVGPDFASEMKALAGTDCRVPDSWLDRLPGGVLDGDAVLRLAARARDDGALAFARALERGAARACERVASPRTFAAPAARWWDARGAWWDADDADVRATPLRYGRDDEEDPFAPAFDCDAVFCEAACLCGKKPRKLHRCARCRVVKFCSAACQKRFWNKHKPRCLHYGALRSSPRRPDWFDLLASGFLNLAAAKPLIAAREAATLDALARDGNLAVEIAANLAPWPRERCRRGKGQALELGLRYFDFKERRPAAAPLLAYALVDAEAPAADVDEDRGAAARGSALAARRAEDEIDRLRGRLHLRGFRVAGVARERGFAPDADAAPITAAFRAGDGLV